MSSALTDSQFHRIFNTVSDPRIARTRRHDLMSVLFIAICGMLSGAEDYVTIAEYGCIKRDWFESLLDLPNGIPSHDTFQRVFARLDPEQLALCLMEWADVLRKQCSLEGEEIVALDGKTLRRSFDTAAGKGAIHIVSAWASKARLSLGQIKVDDKSNEINAVPALLKLLDVKGCIVTADAMHCQKATARQITEQEGTFVLSLKGNQSNLAEAVKLFSEHAQQHKFAGLRTRTCTDTEKDHGRIVTRSYRLIQLPEGIAWQDERRDWTGLKSIGIAQSTRTTAKGTNTETRLYITAIDAEAKDSARRFATAVRNHWGIENSLHWVLDVCFREDDCRVRKDNAPQNLAVLRHLALNLLKRDTTTKAGIKTRRLKAGWDNSYLEYLLMN